MNKEVMDDINDGEKRCPMLGHASRHTGAMGTSANQHWWPNRLNLNILHQNSVLSSPMAKTFDYAKEFKALDLDAVIADLHALMTDSQDWWPADYGHYGPFFIRMAWHSAGTYRIGDGRGGACSGSMRFAPLNSWPDNVNLDKARMLLWPIKQKYGKKLSWADLMILTGNVALESMGFKTFGFAGGRADVWEPEEDIYWGPEGEWLADQRYSAERELEGNLGAVQMGLIYVNPEGPNGEPNPLKSAFDIRDTFGRMAMNDEETVALIAGGHTFGKTHGAADAGKYVGPEPEGAGLTSQGLGWSNSFGSGKGEHAIGSGLEGAWTDNPIQWDNNYFDNLYGYEWEVRKGPGGGWQWYPVDGGGKDAFPDAHNPDKRHTPMMFTSDLALREDPAYNKISKRFHENPDQFADAFAKAWYKLTHRDMGPLECYLGPLVPKETQLWQDPVPALDYGLIDEGDIAALKSKILAAGLSTSQLVSTAWASASTFRQSDRRGGATGARIRLAPQKDWAINKQAGVAAIISALEGIQAGFNGAQSGNKRVSISDLIVLAGCAAVEDAASKAGLTLSVPFTPGRTDALQEQTDIESFAVLEPKSDGFRNYDQSSDPRSAEEQLIDRAQLLGLTAPEMTVLIGGMRALGTNVDGSHTGVFTNRPGMLTTDFFSTVLSMDYKWDEVSGSGDTFEGSLRSTGDVKWTASRIDLLFASNSQLRALAEVYASTGDAQDFADSFAAAWAKVMDADRFDLA